MVWASHWALLAATIDVSIVMWTISEWTPKTILFPKWLRGNMHLEITALSCPTTSTSSSWGQIVVRERRIERYSRSTTSKKKKKKKITNSTSVKKEARKSIFSLLNTLSTRAQTPPRRQRTRPRRTNRTSRPRTQRSDSQRKKIPACRPKTSHHTSTKKERKIRTRYPSKCFLGAGFKTKTRPPIGKLKPLAAVEPLTAWGTSSDSPHFPRIFP